MVHQQGYLTQPRHAVDWSDLLVIQRHNCRPAQHVFPDVVHSHWASGIEHTTCSLHCRRLVIWCTDNNIWPQSYQVIRVSASRADLYGALNREFTHLQAAAPNSNTHAWHICSRIAKNHVACRSISSAWFEPRPSQSA